MLLFIKRFMSFEEMIRIGKTKFLSAYAIIAVLPLILLIII